MNSQIDHEQPLVITPGTYRIADVATAFKASRSSINRYIGRFEIPIEDIEYQGKTVIGLVLDEETIKKIAKAVSQGDNLRASGMTEPRTAAERPEQPSVNPDLVVAESKLELANQRISDMQSLLAERNRLIESKDGEIETLKTSMVMIEQLKRYGALDVGERAPNPMARFGQWIAGLLNAGKPATTYQKIDPVDV